LSAISGKRLSADAWASGVPRYAAQSVVPAADAALPADTVPSVVSTNSVASGLSGDALPPVMSPDATSPSLPSDAIPPGVSADAIAPNLPASDAELSADATTSGMPAESAAASMR
jgi:hypothetical protein